MFQEGIEQRKADTQELEFFGIFTQGDRLPIDRIEATTTDKVFRFVFGWYSGVIGPAVVLCELPVGVKLIQSHCHLKFKLTLL